MATIHSFYLRPEAWKAPFELDADESHHLVRVLRIKEGTRVRLFDGQGRTGFFIVEQAGKTKVTLRLESETYVAPPSVRCTLAAGFSKALRRGWFMEKAVELEAHSLLFWEGDHSQASLPAETKDSWKASLVAGAKQCESAWIPDFTLVQGGIDALVTRRHEFDRAYVLFEGDTHGRMMQKEDLASPGSLLLVVGPEGGFSDREITLLSETQIVPVSLGNRILRWETAAILTLGIAWWARQSG